MNKELLYTINQSINVLHLSHIYIYIFKNQIEILLDQDSEISSNNV